MPNQRHPDQVVTSVSLPRDLLAQVRDRADRDGVNQSDVIRAAVEEYVE